MDCKESSGLEDFFTQHGLQVYSLRPMRLGFAMRSRQRLMKDLRYTCTSEPVKSSTIKPSCISVIVFVLLSNGHISHTHDLVHRNMRALRTHLLRSDFEKDSESEECRAFHE